MLYNRSAKLQVGKYQQEGLLLDGFRIAFTITKTETDEPNRANVEISNLSETTRNKIRQEDGNQIILHAGYLDEGDISVIFIGDITNVTHSITPPDIITKITAGDGAEPIRKKTLSLSYAEGASAQQILEDIVKQMEIPLQRKFSLLDLPALIFNNGFSFQGFAADALTKITKEVGANWSVQNNELKITKKKKSSGLVALRLTDTTGLIGSPVRFREVDKQSEDEDESYTGWEVESLLQPKAEPGDIIEIGSKVITPAAQFEIVEVTHSGDTHGGDWTTRIKVRDL
jgi:hypothetical protein